ncbi:DUF2637 domain-containing protein [Streptomyces sp. NPDC127172]|uniref:DUF2637 domain-containing protein n=1 Tax=Streptomyces sp. NPDC127172 TaxID=3345382 RepID=UPI00362DFFFE
MDTTPRPQLTTMQRRILAGVGLGAAVIAVIGFIGSYTAVRRLAEAKAFGAFAILFPIGLDAGILVLLALDLLLTWLRMKLPLLRHVAWMLTAATIAFNGAAAWPDPIGVGMHAVIPVLFIAVVEAARHAIGVSADIDAAKHMESVRLVRWLLAPTRTFFLWRRMKLWELRSYDAVIALERQRLVERMRLREDYGLMWRRKAPVETVIAYRMLRYGGGPASAGAVTDLALVPAVPLLSQPDALDDFDAVAASALAVAQPDAVDECASVQPQPSAQSVPDAQPEVQPHSQPSAQPVVQPQPDAQPEVQPAPAAQPQSEVQPTAQPAADAQPVVQPQSDRKVTRMRTPEEMAQLLAEARVVNLRALRDSNNKASLRKLQKELSIGQRTAQLIQPQLPDTLDAALAEAQPNVKEA